jgi:antirestriction protein ArdC
VVAGRPGKEEGKGRAGCARRKRGFRPPAAETAHASPDARPQSLRRPGHLYQEITDKIIAELEQGRLPWVQPWAGVSAPLGLPRNAVTGRAYSGINILILWCAVAERGFTGQTWLTLRQALKLGGHVRKGERGATIVYADRFIPESPPRPAA